MRPQTDYAPPDAPIRGHTAAEAEARFIPGRKSPYATKFPIDLPDEMESHQHESRVILWLALAVFVVFAVAATALIVVFLSLIHI